MNTAEEQYSSFKEEYKDDVKAEMDKKVEIERVKLFQRPHSEVKIRRLSKLEKLPYSFPGSKWYREQKPPEIKPLIDHTTGLCKVCEAAGLNYTTLAKTIKRLCVCQTKQCPNWTCLCESQVDDSEECTCGCSCDDCAECKVREFFIKI